MITLLALAVLAFAAYRATQLAVHDTLLDPARDRIFAWQERRPESRLREFVITLISCTYCMGWWISGAILAAYLLATGKFADTPLLVHGIEWFAVAGGQALLNRWDDTRPQVG
ncbi:DUF1360 domain-containing protein [Streptomyces sp. NBC_01591]|uniref:DUF1360 domain-containing protein n=1 Tax=Streptomyces sp. NBC_01591 TaxID=2975888 RepID=UPI002DDB8D22|nr:DUF1360 domain-containing protein [Streptomyces sp. NBC_01591]WSD71740.1 DUF1360 domain-containing protein [Streptomyces sp. NBC_01591]